MNEKISGLKAKIEKLNEDLKVASKAALEEGRAGIFKVHPKLENFGWHQSQEYDDQGSTSFMANTDDPDICFDGEDYANLYRGDDSLKNNRELKRAHDDITGLLNALRDSLEEIFGEDANNIIATKDGFKVS